MVPLAKVWGIEDATGVKAFLLALLSNSAILNGLLTGNLALFVMRSEAPDFACRCGRYDFAGGDCTHDPFQPCWMCSGRITSARRAQKA